MVTKLRNKLAVAMALAGASVLMLGLGDARATGIPVVDGLHSGFTMQGWIAQYGQMYSEYVKQLEQLTTQIRQLETQVKQYKQMHVKGLPYKPKPSYRENIAVRFPERSLGQGIEEQCGKRPRRRTSVSQAQHAICKSMVTTQNRRYNAMRGFLEDVMQNDKQLQAARMEREGIAETDQGALQANTNKMAAIQTKMENDLQNARHTMDAYGSVINALNDDMVRLAKEAMDGPGNPIVQGLALKAALRIARSRDR